MMSIHLKVRNRWAEKRRHQRVAYNAAAEMAVASKYFGFLFSRRSRFQVRIKDRSTMGMRIVADRHLHKGAVVEVWVEVYDKGVLRTLRLRGEVVSSALNDTHQCVAGIKLRGRPKQDMHLWLHDVAESIRRFDGG